MDELQVQIEMRAASPAEIPRVQHSRALFIRNLCEHRTYQLCADLIASMVEPGKVFRRYPLTDEIPWATWSARHVYPMVENWTSWVEFLEGLESTKLSPQAENNGAFEQILLSIGMVWRHLNLMHFANSPSDEEFGAPSLGYTELPFGEVVVILEHGVDLLYNIAMTQDKLWKSLRPGAFVWHCKG